MNVTRLLSEIEIENSKNPSTTVACLGIGLAAAGILFFASGLFEIGVIFFAGAVVLLFAVGALLSRKSERITIQSRNLTL